MSPYRRNHYLAFGLTEPIDHRGMTPAQIVASVNDAGGFGFPAHPFSRGSERFRRGGQGMPWDDLEADGYTGIELWSFVTDTAERVNSIRDLLSFVPRPSGSSTTRRGATSTSGTASAGAGGASAWAVPTRTRSGSASPAACPCA